MRLLVLMILMLSIFGGCVTQKKMDYTNFHAKMPTSILVLPPINKTLEVVASDTYLSVISKPIAERGYYVFPVAMIEAYLKENGAASPESAHHIPIKKLYDIFGADAILYTTIEEWGSSYHVAFSESSIKATCRLVDAKTGVLLWNGNQFAKKNPGSSSGGLVGMLITAAVDQIVNDISDKSHDLARSAAFNSIYDDKNGFLEGPLLEKKTKPH